MQAVNDAEEIRTFMIGGGELFESKADTIQKIGEERQKAKAMVEALPRIMEIWHRLEEKNKLLRQMATGGTSTQFEAVNVKSMANDWGNFTEKLHRYGEVAEDRKNELQKGIVKQVLISA